MSYYLLISIVLTTFICCIFDFIHFKYKKNLFWILIAGLIAVSSSKDENTSWDTGNYINSFNSSGDFSNFFDLSNFRFEPGYVALERGVHLFTDSYSVLFFIISFSTLVILGRVIMKYSPYPFLSLFLYVSIFYFKRDIITIRYGLSCAIMLVSIIHLIQSEYKKSFLWAAIAFMFHYTALSYFLFLPFYWLGKIKGIRIVNIILVLIISLMLSLVGISMLSVVEALSPFLPGIFSLAVEKGLQYLDFEAEGGLKQLVPYIVALILFLSDGSFKKNKFFTGMTICFMFALFCMIEFNQTATFARMNQMYLTIIIFLFPYMLLFCRHRKNYVLMYSYFILYAFYAFIRMSFFNTGGFIDVYW